MNDDANQDLGDDKPPENTEPAQVGFRRPPEATRFKKGVSGNPNGRPKGSVNLTTAFLKALREKVVINEHGRRKTVTKLDAAIMQLVNKAATGDPRALRQLIELARDAESKQNAPVVHQCGIVDDLDQEIMQGILQRFQLDANEAQQPLEEQQSEDVQNGENE